MQTVVVVEFLSDEDECVSGPCQHDSKCHVDGTSYKCECTGAWEGTTCSSKCYYGDSLHGVLLLRAEKLNKYAHAHVFDVYQAPSLKKWRNFADRETKKLRQLRCFPNSPCKQQHFHVSNGELEYCFRGESFFSDKIELNRFPNHLFLRRTPSRNFCAKTNSFQKRS